MTLKASFLFCLRMIRPRCGIRSAAHRSLTGAVLCIAVSLIPLVVLLVVADGMIQGITERIIELSSYHIQVQVPRYGSAASDAEPLKLLAENLSGTEGVCAAYAEIQGIALAAGQEGRIGASVRAVDPAVFDKDSPFGELFALQDGVMSLSGENTALIGVRIAEQLGLRAGDPFRIITMRRLGTKMVPKITVMKAVGIISCGYQELDALWIFVPLETGAGLFDAAASQAVVGLRTADAFDIPELVRTENAVRRRLPTGYGIAPWNELNVAQYENFASTKQLLLFIMFLIILAASVNVSSALVMLVMERRKEIAILKSMGASSEGITMAFLMTGFAAGFCGVAAGIPAGLLCAVNVNGIIAGAEKMVNAAVRFLYIIRNGSDSGAFVPVHLLDPAFYLQEIPIIVPLFELFATAAGTLFLAVAASVLPGIRAGKEKPIETLRKI